MTQPSRNLLIFGAACALLVTGASTLTYVVNPMGVFPTRVLPPAVWTDRADKPAAYERLDTRPQAIVLGSSRSMKINPVEVTRLTGLPAFNFAVTGAMVEDLFAIVRFCLDRDAQHVKRLLIGADPDAFHNAWAGTLELRRSRMLGRYAGVSPPSPFEDLIGWSAIDLSVRSLYQRVRFGHQPPRGAFGPDGFLTYPAWEQEVRAGTYRFEPGLAFTISEYAEKYEGFTALDEKRKESFVELLRTARASGIEVDAFITILHPRLAEALASTSAAARTEETRRFLAGLDKEGLLRFCDVRGLEDFGGDPAAYFDGSHMMESNATKLIAHVLACVEERHGLQ